MRSGEPIPPDAPRTDPAARLRREIWIARDAGEHQLAAQLLQRLDALGAPGEPEPPQRETAAAKQPNRSTNARTTAKKTAPRKPRSSRHVPRQ